jgi:hypothetical protein
MHIIHYVGLIVLLLEYFSLLMAIWTGTLVGV